MERYVARSRYAAEARALWPRSWVALAHRSELTEVRERAGYRLTPSLEATFADAPARVEVGLGGLVWACADPDAPPLAAALAPVPHHLEGYGIDGWSLDDAVVCELRCNWKLSVDAHDEGYHVGVLHPEAAGVVDDEGERIERHGRHSRIVVPMGRPRRGTRLHPQVRGLLEDAQVDPAPFETDAEGARRALQRARRRPCHAALLDDQLTDNHQWHVFPNLQLNVYADHALLFSHWPGPSPDRCLFEQRVLVREGGRCARLEQVEAGSPRFGPVTGADLRLLPELQRSYASGQLAAVTLGWRERPLGWFHRAVDRLVEG